MQTRWADTGVLSRVTPSLNSLIACAMLLSPLVYVLSYVPVVRMCGRSADDAFFGSGLSGTAGGSMFVPRGPSTAG